MLALPIFTVRKRLSFCREETCRGHVLGKDDSRHEKSLPFQEGLCWRYLFSQPVARQLSSAQMSLTSVFGMGTGGPSSQSTPTIYLSLTGFPESFIIITALKRFVKYYFNNFLGEKNWWPVGESNSRLRRERPLSWPLDQRAMVHLHGLEPGTHWLRVSCSTNWAKGASSFLIQGTYHTLKTEHILIFHDFDYSCNRACFLHVGQAFGLLVSVSLMHCCTYTPDLSTT